MELYLHLFFGKLWYTDILTNFNIQVFNTFTIVGHIKESILKLINNTNSKIFGDLIFIVKVFT